jgi:hypothetical protein
MGATVWTAAATLEPPAGEVVVVVVVVGGVLDCRTTPRDPAVGTLVEASGGEVGGVTGLGPGPRTALLLLVVVVVVAGAGAVDVPWWCFADLSGAAARFPGGSG